MKTIKLGVADRINLEGLLPAAGGRIQMTLVRDLKTRIIFTPEEIRDFQMSDDTNGIVRWNTKLETDLEIEVSEEQLEILRTGIVEIDQKGVVTLQMLGLIEKIEN